MSQAADTVGIARPSYVRVVSAVMPRISFRIITSFCSPLLPFVRDEYGVSYTEIGLAFAAFNIVSTVGQTPAGFLVDGSGRARCWSPAF